ncbi:MAG: hypothetical protein GKR89_11080 [Candidatus Latescibacteria bacterium]|nr:hypothetical protein [Candidatus Latescibacterota bacterium]
MLRSGNWYLCTLIVVLALGPLLAQEYGARLGTVQRGGRVSFEPTGPGVLLDALDPAVHKWYVPQELYAEYGWRQRQYSNYARSEYQRYVSTSLEGDYFYDLYGNFLTRGWLIYDWRQVNPQPFGSGLEKSRRFDQWFNSLVVASDHKGQYHYTITIGNQIRTTLTPMTFSKPLFNGLQWDFASDKYASTLLLSRIGEPNSPSGGSEQRTNNTNFFGGRLVVQVGDFAKVGGTLLNAHHAQTQLETVNGDIFKGQLTEFQNFSPVTLIEIAISDDSPADGEGGGALFSSDIIVTDLEGMETRGSQIGYRPLTEGGFQRRGFLAADGTERILVRYDLTERSYIGPDPSEISRIQIELVIANDYRVEVASDRQLDGRSEIVFLPVARAGGNVKDGSNQRVLLFDYGLPTANHIAGFTLELTDLEGLEGYLEVDVNQRYRQFPNPNTKRHHAASDRGLAWMANVSKTAHPFFAFVEAFNVSPRYGTDFVVADADGVVDYGNQFQRYEFVDDNDDQDRRPDWRRKGWGLGDDEIFPGWDENNDFVSDFNQNDNEDSPNLIADYEEPFLRFYADRPEFLYGVDMNHNLWIDRFENDEQADYPYERDRRGYNAYAGAFVYPDLRLMVGRLRLRQLTDNRHNRATYFLVVADRHYARLGRLRLFQDVRKVKDTIADDLLQWQQPPNTRGGLHLVGDPLPAPDTWINTTWLGWDQQWGSGLKAYHKLKWTLHHQRSGRIERALRGQRRQASFFGLINKAEYRFVVGDWTLAPRWKSEFRRSVPISREEPRRRELTELFILTLRFPIMRQSFIEGGLEYEYFNQLEKPTPPGAEDSFNGLTTTVQMSNISDYQGYRLVTTLGLEARRIDSAVAKTEVLTRGFITVYAAVEL